MSEFAKISNDKDILEFDSFIWTNKL
uniref:Uncharacterized protein n=1 Tax=Tetranychus urticae TaxID=32264 RepID=T1KKW5_TETUR